MTFNMRQFSDLPKHLEPALPGLRNSQVLMYCTGGIRCERASAYLKQCGVEDVFQLEDGICSYMDTYPEGAQFEGKNFVFDKRMAVASNNPKVLSNCEFCPVEYDTYDDGRRCTHCRSLVLACPSCQESAGGLYRCINCTSAGRASV